MTVPAAAQPRVRRPTRAGARRFLGSVLTQTLRDPVRAGRIRDEDWPYGLCAVVALAYLMLALSAALVLTSGLIRAHSPLTVVGATTVAIPSAALAPLVVLLSFAAALFMTAALNGPWWLRLVGLVFTLALGALWSLSGAVVGGWRVLAAGVLLLALVVYAVVRWRRPFAWWDFLVLWALVGGLLLIGVMLSQAGKTLGTDFTPLLLQSVATTLGTFALPAAMAAGAATAEITVRATVAAVENTRRLRGARLPYVVLAVAVAVRLGQLGWVQLAGGGLVSDPAALLVALVLVALLAGLALLVLRLGRRHADRPSLDTLGDDLSGLAFKVAAILVCAALPLQVVLLALPVLGALGLGQPADTASLGRLFGEVTDPIRILVGLGLVALALRDARQGRSGRALVGGAVGVMLVALARNFIVGPAYALPIDLDAISLVVTAVAVVLGVLFLLRRRLTQRRAVALGGVMVLSLLVAYRDFLSDPLGALLGFSGAALVLFGLVWDLLTGSDWGNATSRRFPRPARVLLLLTNTMIAMTVLAYASLVRDGSTSIYLGPYAELGDLVFGTALLAAAVFAVFDAARFDRELVG